MRIRASSFILLFCSSLSGCCLGISPSHHYTCREATLPEIPPLVVGAQDDLPYRVPVENPGKPRQRKNRTISSEECSQGR